MKIAPIFTNKNITCRMLVPVSRVLDNLTAEFMRKFILEYEGICSVEDGYIETESTRYVSHSVGIFLGSYAQFMVTFNCNVHKFDIGDIVKCKITIITKKGGIQAENLDANQNVFVIFITKEYIENIDKYKVGDCIYVKIKSCRLKLHAPKIEYLGQLPMDV